LVTVAGDVDADHAGERLDANGHRNAYASPHEQMGLRRKDREDRSMTETTKETVKTSAKRLSKSARAHTRRLKAAARKAGTARPVAVNT
jgi:hypothetical protein